MTKRLLLSPLLVFFIAGAIFMACTSYCFAADIQPPTDEQVGEWTGPPSVEREAGVVPEGSFYKYIKMHKLSSQGGKVKVNYYLAIVYTDTRLSQVSDSVRYTAFEEKVECVKGPEGQVSFSRGAGCFESALSDDEEPTSMDEVLSELDGLMQNIWEVTGFEPGWPVVSSTGETISPGSDESPEGETHESKAPETGGKIPGPESWWQWLTGTVVAGTIAAGLGLAGTLLGSAPPAPPLMGVFDPSPPDIAGGPLQLPSSVEIGLPPPETGLIDQALMNTFEDIGTIPGYLTDKAKWAFIGLTDMDNLKTALEEVEEWSDPVRDALRDKLQEVVDGTNQFTDSTRNITDDPLKPFNLLGEEQLKLGDALAKYIKENPREILEGFLRGEWWENAMDWRRPLLERLGWSTIATLNTIGLIQGASGLKSWLFGGAEKKLVGKALTGKVVPKLKSPKSAWKKAVSTPEGKIAANTTWKEQVAAGKGKVKAWKEAMREGGDAEARTRALLEIRRDPAALKNLNDEGSRALVTKYNKGINGLQDSALEKGRKTLVGELGVSDEQVRIFKATNRSTGVTAKNDLDFTYQVKKDGKWVDVPSPKAQEHFDQAFHKGVGSPSDVTPGQLSKDLRCKAVAQHDAEALGLERADFNAAKSGKTAPNPQTVGQGIEYKVNENLVEADRLTTAGDIAGANTQRSLAQREISKAYNNQIEGRIKYLKERGGNMALVDKKIAGVEDAVRDMKAMQKSNATPADISEMLGKRGWTEESLGKRMGEIYEELNR